jgi:murein DD-endopeptidase MepM/ murein hydrolase activator NlpD
LKNFFCSIKAGALIETSFRSKIRLFSFLLLLLGSVKSFAAAGYKINERTKIYTQQISADSVLLKMDNDLSVPVSVKLLLNLNNIQDNGTSSVHSIIPANASGYIVAGFRKKDSTRPYAFNYTWKIVLGDVSKTAVPDYRYGLPFMKGHNYKLSQGPDGSFSHQDLFAYDFEMPVGTPVVAARDGIIAMIKTDSSIGGPDKSKVDNANFISVYHEDGTIANYFHLNKNGSAVKEGQFVKKGQIIGYSGNTGFTSGPHLHFEVVEPNLNSDKNQLVKFSWEISDNYYTRLNKVGESLKL